MSSTSTSCYSEAKWWRHPVVIPDDLKATAQVKRAGGAAAVFHEEAPELIEQYVKAFERSGDSGRRLA